MSFNLSKIQALTKDKFTENHVKEFTQMYMMDEKDLIPDAFAYYLAERGPRTEEEVALWVWLCLEKQGLSGPLTRKPNDLQPSHTAQVKFMSDCFFENIQDVIVLGNRASGKTLMFGALIALESMYKPFMEHAHLGAIKEQATKCYSYFKKIIEHPMFAHRLKSSTQAKTELNNGSEISILTGTMTGVNCLHGDTLIECSRNTLIYPNGVPIRELVGKEIAVPTIHEETGKMEYRKAVGIYSGKAPCIKVTISYKDVDRNCDRTEEIICTPEHRFLMLNSHKYKEAQKLQPGDRLVPFDPVRLVEAKENSRFTMDRRVNLRQSWNNSLHKLCSESREIAKAMWGADAIEGMDVHHIDENRLNNDPSNLQLMTPLEHHKHHFGEDSQGYITEESLKKMSKSKTTYGVDPVWQEKEWFEARIKEGRTLSELAVELRCTPNVLYQWKKRHGLDDLYKQYSIHRTMTQPKRDQLALKTKTFNPLAKSYPWQDKRLIQEKFDNGYSAQQLADEWGCNLSTIKHWCTKLGVNLPISKFDNRRELPYHNKEVLLGDIEMGMTVNDMAKKYDVDPLTITRHLKLLDIEHLTVEKQTVKEIPDYQKEEWLRARLEEGLSQTQIANLCGVQQTTVGRFIREYGLDVEFYDNAPVPLYRDYDYLVQCVKKGMSQTDIAKAIGCSRTAVLKGLARHGLETFNTKNKKVKLYQDEQWLRDKLVSGMTITDIAKEAKCSIPTIYEWMKKFNLQGIGQPGDNQRGRKPFYDNHVVEKVEWYMNGEPQDVYDLSVQTTEEDEHYRHNFSLSAGVLIRNSPHPIVASLDEMDLMGWNILQEALMMASSSRGYLASTRITSTRKFSNGPMQRLIDEAVQRNMIIQQWNLWDVIEPCPLRTDRTTYVEVPVYSAGKDTFINREVEVFDDCLTCALLPKCQGKAKYSHGGLVTIPDAIRMYHTLDKDIWDAQVECLRPGSSDVIYNMFSEATHVIHNYEFNPNRPVYAGQDFGYHQPATVFLQPLDDNMDKWIVFDEIYEGDIATSVLINDFIMPKYLEYGVQLFLCDPAGKSSIADMEVQGLPVIAGENVVEAGIDLVKSLFASNRLYISDKCVNLLLELKKYSRTEMGRIRKENDHACDALRYAVMEINQYAGVNFDAYY